MTGRRKRDAPIAPAVPVRVRTARLEVAALADARELGHDPHPFTRPRGVAWTTKTACRLCGRGIEVRVRAAGDVASGAALEYRCDGRRS